VQKKKKRFENSSTFEGRRRNSQRRWGGHVESRDEGVGGRGREREGGREEKVGLLYVRSRMDDIGWKRDGVYRVGYTGYRC